MATPDVSGALLLVGDSRVISISRWKSLLSIAPVSMPPPRLEKMLEDEIFPRLGRDAAGFRGLYQTIHDLRPDMTRDEQWAWGMSPEHSGRDSRREKDGCWFSVAHSILTSNLNPNF